MKHPPFTIAGHRGVMAHAPENSLQSFAMAEQAGADEIELDVRLSSDGVLIVLHDETLDRVGTDASGRGLGPVAELTLARLSEVRLDSGRPILTLAEAYAATGITIQAEVKDPAIVHALVDFYTARPDDAARTIVTGFDPVPLEVLADLLPEVPRGIIVPDYATAEAFPGGVDALLARTGSSIFHCGWEGLTADVVDAMHAAGLGVRGWPVRGYDDMERAVRLGVDGITSDDPALALSWYRRALEDPAGESPGG
jgi:glycerophosphoryl diester phosphodiesterase